MKNNIFYASMLSTAVLFGCQSNSNSQKQGEDTTVTTKNGAVDLPAPDTNAAKSKFSKVIG